MPPDVTVHRGGGALCRGRGGGAHRGGIWPTSGRVAIRGSRLESPAGTMRGRDTVLVVMAIVAELVGEAGRELLPVPLPRIGSIRTITSAGVAAVWPLGTEGQSWSGRAQRPRSG